MSYSGNYRRYTSSTSRPTSYEYTRRSPISTDYTSYLTSRTTSGGTSSQYGRYTGLTGLYRGYQGSILTGSRSQADQTFKPNKPKPESNVNYWEYWDQAGQDQAVAPAPAPDKPKPEIDTRFKVLDVDLKKLNNKFDHHTFSYEHRNLVVRRGQAFTIIVKLDKEFKRGEDVLKLQFVTGNMPRESRGTMFLITPGDAIDVTTASAIIDFIDKDENGSSVRLSVNLPADSVVGRFTLVVRVMNKENKDDVKKYTKYKVEEPIIMLYNPWCKEDAVYMEDKEERKEYIDRQSGIIYVGASYRPSPKPWTFGQYDSVCLDAALYLLDISRLPVEAYGNPVRVARSLSAMVNFNDNDYGVLMGNWSGKYDDGTSPSAWNGSVRILEEYMETKQPVKYGQCWVFSGLCTTIGRSLGIPTRSVSNFDSAHDRDISMSCDMHVNEQGDPIKHLNDSIWNFHVWNESWFKRADLPAGNDGWQAFDATPQESSDNRMQCGPASVRAIKEGNVHFGYDAPFIFAEVNGDRVIWQVNAAEERTVLKVQPAYVGAKISTKAVGKRERLDLTNDYKYPEGSSEERCVAKKVSQVSTRMKGLEEYYYRNKDKVEDVEISFFGDVTPKGSVEFAFTVANKSAEERNVTTNFSEVATYYTGVDGEVIMKKKKEFKLAPGAADEIRWITKASEWLNAIDEDASIGLYVLAKVKETPQTFVYRTTYSLQKPELEVKVASATTQVQKPFEVTLSFTNPLEIPLTNGSFLIEGAGIKTEKKIIIRGTIAAGEVVSRTITLTPKMVGEREVIASFHSRQLVGIFGSAEIEVVE